MTDFHIHNKPYLIELDGCWYYIPYGSLLSYDEAKKRGFNVKYSYQEEEKERYRKKR